MASILYAWELGANLGHVGAFMPLANELRARGHTVHWAVTQPAQVGEFLAAQGFRWLAAPTHPEVARPGPPLSYADILLRFGYANSGTLFGITGAWRELMRLSHADLVLTDHAPTAVLAARTMGLPVMSFSYGFTLPPRKFPLPALRSWAPPPADHLMALDQQACATINAVLARFDQLPLASTAALYDIAEATLLTFPELDHYPARGAAHYWGSLPAPASGAAPQWPDAPGPRVFAYLRRETPHLIAVMHALHTLGWPTLVICPGIADDLRIRFAATHLAFVEQLVDLPQAVAGATLGITYASLTTTTAFLLAGKPLLLLPGHLEQYLLAQRVVELGAGLCISAEGPPPDFGVQLRALAQEPHFAAAASAFSLRYAAFDQSTVLHNLVRRIEELAAPTQETPNA